MRRTALLRRAKALAEAGGASWELVREGANHSVFRVRGVNVPVPRHREINERTAQGILRQVGRAAQGGEV